MSIMDFVLFLRLGCQGIYFIWLIEEKSDFTIMYYFTGRVIDCARCGLCHAPELRTLSSFTFRMSRGVFHMTYRVGEGLHNNVLFFLTRHRLRKLWFMSRPGITDFVLFYVSDAKGVCFVWPKCHRIVMSHPNSRPGTKDFVLFYVLDAKKCVLYDVIPHPFPVIKGQDVPVPFIEISYGHLQCMFRAFRCTQ